MITDRDLVTLEHELSPYTRPPMPRARGLAIMLKNPLPGWTMRRVPTCPCCGVPAWPNGRCTKHQDRNPCAIEGCTRTRKVVDGQVGNDLWLCGEHWKRYVPPHSPARRAYHRFWRLAKKQGGWDEALVRRFNRFWDGLIKRVRRASTEGQLDEKAIREMFGWSEDDNPGEIS